jgi:hypothetical protein
VVAGTGHLTLVVTTADGIYERTVSDASPLNTHVKRGVAAEGAVRDAAATWGLPDLFLRPHVERKGGFLEFAAHLGDAGVRVGLGAAGQLTEGVARQTSASVATQEPVICTA